MAGANPSLKDPSVLPKDARIYVAGHRGMVGSAIVRRLQTEGYSRILTRTHAELDLTHQGAVRDFFRAEGSMPCFWPPARVGGIHANNTRRADFIYENLMIECNVIHAAFAAGCRASFSRQLLHIYPRDCPQPIAAKEYLLQRYLEPTNEPYAWPRSPASSCANLTTASTARTFARHCPANLYGPHDSFDLENSHVLPDLRASFILAAAGGSGDGEGMRRNEQRFGAIPRRCVPPIRGGRPVRGGAPMGTGAPRREFLHVDDMAAAVDHAGPTM